MFDWMKSDKHAIAVIKDDHAKVKNLFEQFETTESSAEKEAVMRQALTELKMHAVIEEEIFYPTVRAQVGEEIMNEADEEHHVAKLLIAELESPGGDRGHREAKFKVLAESVRHHIREEENEVLPKAQDLSLDFEALGQQMLHRKTELLEEGFPQDAEHAMVSRVRGNDDSPAAAAAKSQGKKTTRAKSTAAKSNGAKSSNGKSTKTKATASKSTGAKKAAGRRAPAKTAKARG